MSISPLYDHPHVTSMLFHPRREDPAYTPAVGEPFSVTVAEGISVSGRWVAAERTGPTILFFHGNGEIVSDYDDLALYLSRMGWNFMPVEYRGYGNSTGFPSATAMLRDCHLICARARDLLAEKGFTGPLVVMGRSLGSASAIELASSPASGVRALILDSAFAFTLPLLRLMGIDTARMGLKEEEGFANLNKIKDVGLPTLLLHGERDALIPLQNSVALYETSPAADKTLITIKDADHNTLLYHGFSLYMSSLGSFLSRIPAV